MSREEDLIRSTTRAIASTVREVPPLQLEPAANELESPAFAPRRPPGGGRRPRRWRSWGVPLIAATVVVALAISLVLVKDLTNGSAVSGYPATSSVVPGGVPRYYVALEQLAGDVNSSNQRNDIVVGDSLTGKILATIAPPARTAFESVTAAADDRTFVVFGVTSSTGSFGGDPSIKGPTMTGNWYEVSLAPGTAHPARLTRLPIAPVTASSTGITGLYEFIDSFGSVLSASGAELAVPAGGAWGGSLAVPSSAVTRSFAVRVFSVATGKLLDVWTTPHVTLAEEPSLTWIDGDRDLALLSRNQVVPAKSPVRVTTNVTVREWPVASLGTSDLIADSKVVWTMTLKSPQTAVEACTEPVVGGAVVISADGKTFSCTTAGGSAANDRVAFHTYPLAASTTATTPGTTDYLTTFSKEQGQHIPEVLWSSPSGSTLIGALFPYDGSAAAIADGTHIGVISHGTFTSLRLPASLAKSTLVDIAF